MTPPHQRRSAPARRAVAVGVALVVGGVALMALRFVWNDAGIWRTVFVAASIGAAAAGARMIATGLHDDR